MGLQSSDLLLVERSNTVYKETFGNRANIDDTDLILVERSNTVYKCTWSDWDDGGGGGGGGGTGTHGWASSNASPVEITVNTDSVSSDSTAAYNIFSYQMSVTGGDSTDTGRLYIGLRMRGSVSYYHDFCLGGVQILTSAGNAFRTDSTFTNGYDWNFHNSGTSNGRGGWQKSTSALSSQTYTADPSSLSYATISTASNGQWSYGTSTSSAYTGAADGIYGVSQYSGGGGSIFSSSGTISQSSSTNYIYTETSGSGYTIGTTTIWVRSPEITVTNNDYLRMAYHAYGGNTSSNGLGYRGDDVLYFRFK